MQIPSERWTQIEELFTAATALPPEERAPFVRKRAADDPDLCREVLSLLEHDIRPGAALTEQLECETVSLVDDKPLDGSVVGPYRIEHEIGRGGMAIVYLAVREGDFRKRVAIKLIRRGMDTGAVIQRLRRERRILAALDHPYIARLLDGGATSDGLPWIAMEYVEGVPIQRFCEDSSLSIEDRCRLIVKVCEAVGYAHRSLVIHRDLKPGNILVDAWGNPQLLDFGIARLLTADEDSEEPLTRGPAIPLTPEYASPEQIAGGPMGVGADVYSLGVVLFELLAGVRPGRADGVRLSDTGGVKLSDAEGVKLSNAARRAGKDRKWVRALEGDLDNILRMALEPEPRRRYLSVAQLERDLKLYLAGMPVEAREETIGYRLGKFLRRNRLRVAAAGFVALALCVGAVTTLWQAHRAQQKEAEAELQARESQRARAQAEREHTEAERQRAQAESGRVVADTERQLADRRFGQVRELSNRFLFDFETAIAPLPGSTPARKMVVETGLKYYDSLVRDAAGNQDLLEEAARGYDKLGDVQGNPYGPNIGDLDGSLASYKKALSIRRDIQDTSPAFVSDRLMGFVRLGQISIGRAEYPQCEKYLREGIALGQTEMARPEIRASLDARGALASLYVALGDLKVRTGVDSEAIEPYRKNLELRKELAPATKDPTAAQLALAIAGTKVGDALGRSGRSVEGVEYLRPALEIIRRLAGENPGNARFQRMVYISYNITAQMLAAPSGQPVAAPGEIDSDYQAAIAMAGKMIAADPQNQQPLLDLSVAADGYGEYLLSVKRYEDAIVQLRRSLDGFEKLDRASGEAGGNISAVVEVHQYLAQALAATGQFDEAHQHVRDSEAALKREAAQAAGVIEARKRGEHLQTVGIVATAEKKWDESIAAWREAVEIFQGEAARQPDDRLFSEALPDLHAGLARALAGSGQTDSAAQAMRKAIESLAAVESGRPLTPEEKTRRTEYTADLARWNGTQR